MVFYLIPVAPGFWSGVCPLWWWTLVLFWIFPFSAVCKVNVALLLLVVSIFVLIGFSWNILENLLYVVCHEVSDMRYVCSETSSEPAFWFSCFT